MNQPEHALTSTSSHLTTSDKAAWKRYWQEQGQAWRNEPEIATERQRELADYRAIVPNIEQGIYPFKGQKLTRADVEWLIATANDGNGQRDVQHGQTGLDLRGTDLSYVNLSNLPLSCLHGGLTLRENRVATVEQSELAAVCLEHADLTGAHLEGANLSRANLDKAILVEAHLEGADLGTASLKQAILAGAHLEGAVLAKAQLEDAVLLEAHLEGINLQGASLAGANLLEAHLEGARLLGASLEGTNLLNAHLGGKRMAENDLVRIRRWLETFPPILRAADLRFASFDNRSTLGRISLGDVHYGFVSLGDVRWNNANLTAVDWKHLKRLGDEYGLDSSHEPKNEPPQNADTEQSETRQQIAVLLRAMEVQESVIHYIFHSPTLLNKLQQRQQRQARTQQVSGREARREHYETAVRANRQLTVALQAQGLNEDAARFAYRAQILQRQVLLLSGVRSFGSFLFSLFLDLLAGYGYKPGRTLLAYLLTLLSFALAYYLIDTPARSHPSFLVALILSVTAFHGRGIFPLATSPSLLVTVLGAIEAVIGLTIEISFIATFTQRFFGK